MLRIFQIILGVALFILIIWAIVYSIQYPDELGGCPPDNYCERSGPG